MRFAWSVFLVVVGLMSTVSASRDTAAIRSTRFQLGVHREPLVRVMVNGAGPFIFILDTGSSHTSISDDLAEALAAPAAAKTTLTTSLGTALRPIVRLDRMQVGAVDLPHVLATVVLQGAIDPHKRITGVIGQDLLAGRRYLLDFEAREVIWDPPETHHDPAASVLSLVFERERFLVELPQDGSTLRLVPDSGAEALVLFARQDSKLPAHRLAPGRFWLSTLTNQQEVRPINIHELRIGITTLRELPALVIDENDSRQNDSDGLLPLHLFNRVMFDGPRRAITIEPRS